MVANRLSALIPPLDKQRYDKIEQLIEETLLGGTVNEAIIANAARGVLKAVKLLEDYQGAPEWRRFGWGNCLVRLDGKMYYIGELRCEKGDFDKHPFYAYEVVGVKKFKLKRKVDVNSGWDCDAQITWNGIKKMQLLKGQLYLRMPYKYVNELLNKD